MTKLLEDAIVYGGVGLVSTVMCIVCAFVVLCFGIQGLILLIVLFKPNTCDCKCQNPPKSKTNKRKGKISTRV